MTPERAFVYHEAFAHITARVDGKDASARWGALAACIPLLYNMRVPSARAQYLRRMAYLAPGYAETPEQFTQQMLPHIDAYGAGLSAREILQAAGCLQVIEHDEDSLGGK